MTLAERIARASVAVGAFAADKRNKEQNYDYISADQVLSRAGDALAKESVALFPSVLDETVEVYEYVDNYNKTKRRYDARVTFNMVLSDGETTLELVWIGRGSDYAVPDKALYKAITSGHKYFLMKLLNIGVGNEDGEHETADEQPARPAQKPAAKPAPAIEYPPELAVVTNSQGEPYVTLDSEKLGFMLSSITKSLAKPDTTEDAKATLSMKAQVIRDILALRK
jgi:hypothetical protein